MRGANISYKIYAFLYFSVLISHLETKHALDGETLFLGLPVFMSRLRDCYGHRNLLTVKTL